MLERSATTSTTYNTTNARLNLHGRSGKRSDSDVDVVCRVGNGCTISHTYQTCVANLLVLVGNLLRSESCVVDVNLTRSRAVIHRAIKDTSDSTRVSLVGDGHINACQLHILDICCSDIEQWSVQALDCEVATVEGVLAKVLDWSPLDACHIDLGSNLSRSAWIECTCNLCKCDKILSALDQELLAVGIGCVSLVSKLLELTNNTCVDCVDCALELNSHLLVSLGVNGNHESTILSCRNSNVNSLSLVTEYQTLCEGYGCSVRCALQSGQSASCAVYSMRTCDCALLRLNTDACYLLAVTLERQAQYTCEVVELNRSLLLALCESCSIAVHWSYARSKRAYGVRLSRSESYRVNCTLANTLCCRINNTEWTLESFCEAESCLSSLLCNACQRIRSYAINSNSVTLAPIEWIEALNLLAELSTRLLQRDRNLISTLLALDIYAEVLSCVGHARKCEQTCHNCHENFCQIFHCN